MTNEQISMCEDIAEYYGEEHQMLKAVEEMAELTHVIIRAIDDDSAFSPPFMEELADVCIMVEQLKYFCDMRMKSASLNRHISAKLERQMRRMEDEADA